MKTAYEKKIVTSLTTLPVSLSLLNRQDVWLRWKSEGQKRKQSDSIENKFEKDRWIVYTNAENSVGFFLEVTRPRQRDRDVSVTFLVTARKIIKIKKGKSVLFSVHTIDDKNDVAWVCVMSHQCQSVGWSAGTQHYSYSVLMSDSYENDQRIAWKKTTLGTPIGPSAYTLEASVNKNKWNQF